MNDSLKKLVSLDMKLLGAQCESGQIQLPPDQVVRVVGLMEASADLELLAHGNDASDHAHDSFLQVDESAS